MGFLDQSNKYHVFKEDASAQVGYVSDGTPWVAGGSYRKGWYSGNALESY
jgi:hypothetical protein